LNEKMLKKKKLRSAKKKENLKDHKKSSNLIICMDFMQNQLEEDKLKGRRLIEL